ncbi:unnamed protein product [Spirodela intermedia]|uniref:prephenate dehydratase n=1 Tax=Spirodela intermedia TaxID=51605 RepID=A0A7I8K676_SPIIN|nr:unnamed protein product [Spirodela intermedia]
MACSSHLSVTRSFFAVRGEKNSPASPPTVCWPRGDAPGTVRVAYQGISGAYSEFAAGMACPGCATVACRTLGDAVRAVKRDEADRLVLPVESTTEACAVRNYDLLLQNDLHIVREIRLFVDYCLLAMPGVRKRELRKVISHPRALAHCGQALNQLGLHQEAVDDTAGAGRMLLSGGMLDTAAIASPRAAALYGLEVLVQGLQDEAWNVTRFLVLSRYPETPKRTEGVKTSIAIAYRGGALAALMKVLSAFSRRGINLTKLEVNNPSLDGGEPVLMLDLSRRGALMAFPHVLYVDLEGSLDDPEVEEAMAEISSFSVLVRTLGCYPADPNIYDL